MEFKRYASIENSYREKFIEKLVMEGKNTNDWVATEKIHGSNLSLWIKRSPDGNHEIKVGKRSGFLREDELSKFFRSDLILEWLTKPLHRLLDAHTSASEIVVHGEIFGGVYPHPDVPINSKVSKVQKGVYYSPDINFAAFDLRIDGFLVDYHSMAAYCTASGIGYLEPLFIGSFEDCLKYNNEFQTTIPAQLGLPEIENNICEGVVLKPIVTDYLYDRSRVILKNKNDKFRETEKIKRPNCTPKIPILLTDTATELYSIVDGYCTENRLDNVISKIGVVELKDFGKVMKSMNSDAIEEFMKDNKDKFMCLVKKEQRHITKKFGTVNAPLIKNYFRRNV